MTSDEDVGAPRQLTPAFYGAFDWHSAVHGHWTLARIARLFPFATTTPLARAALAQSLTHENIEGELGYLRRADRAGFERPYGLAWLLTLSLELAQWGDPAAVRWSGALRPLADLAANRLSGYWLKLTHPVRSGEHSQTAFALALAIDWARGTGAADFEGLFSARVHAFHEGDRKAPLHREPSGQDFLSPSLAEADLMRRVLAPPAFAAWLAEFLPDLPEDGSTPWLSPVVAADRSDGKLAHFDGLNLSRAWMLEGIAGGLPVDDARRAALLAAADEHARSGLAALTSDPYEVTHWLASFATYLVTQRGSLGPTGVR